MGVLDHTFGVIKMSSARAGWIATLGVCLIKVLLGGVTIEGYISFIAPDYSGMALLLGAVGAVHWGREQTRSKENMN